VTGFASRYGRWALVAGGSEGLGRSFGATAAARGLDVVLVARRPGPLASAAAGLRDRYGVQVRTLAADLADPRTHHELLPAATDGLEIGLVVANAARAPVGPFLGLEDDDRDRVLRINCGSAVELAGTFLPPMVERGRGGFVVVSSAAGLQGSPGLALYAASKAFGRVLAEGLWAELRPHGVDALACVAGAVSTPGYAASGIGRAPGMLTSERVAALTLDRLGRGPVTVPGRFMAVSTRLLGLLPRRTAVTVMGRASRSLTPPAG
jgi:short-subunit dehydrogenase